MDRNTLTGLVLMMLLLLGYQWYMAPSEEEIAAWEAQEKDALAAADSLSQAAYLEAEAQQTSVAALQAGNEDSAVASRDALDAELRRQFGLFGPGVVGTDRDVVMQNDQVRVTFNTRGCCLLYTSDAAHE